jgi:hypothetical protein
LSLRLHERGELVPPIATLAVAKSDMIIAIADFRNNAYISWLAGAVAADHRGTSPDLKEQVAVTATLLWTRRATGAELLEVV